MKTTRAITILLALASLWITSPANAFGANGFGSIKHDGDCLTAGRDTGNLAFETCDDSDISQYWFTASGEPTVALVKRRLTRNLAYPWACVTRIKIKRGDDKLALRDCTGKERQSWSPNWLSNEFNNGVLCYTRKGDGGKIRLCNAFDKRQTIEANKVSSASHTALARFIERNPDVDIPDNHPLHAWALCGDEDDGKEDYDIRDCHLNIDTLRIKTARYGFFVGQDHGYEKGETNWPTLDLGDRYSVDRCAKAHDIGYWSDMNKDDFEGNLYGEEGNETNMMACLNKVVPFNRLDDEAQDTSWKGMAYLAGDVTRAKRSCMGRGAGYLPAKGASIPSCASRKSASANAIAEAVDKAARLAAEAARLAALAQKPADDVSASIDREITRGDTVWNIWDGSNPADFAAYVEDFRTLNPGVNPDLIYAGQTYTIPPRAEGT